MAAAGEKTFVDGSGLAADSFELAYRVWASGFVPDFLLVLWRGGTPIGVGVHDYLEYKGLVTEHAVVKASSYAGVDVRGRPVIQHAEGIVAMIPQGAKVLIIDDIFDSGRTVEEMCRILHRRSDNVRIATLYWKPSANRTSLKPDYYVYKTDRWVVFPHELVGLSDEEIRCKGERISELVNRSFPGKPEEDTVA